MRAYLLVRPGHMELTDVERPVAGPGEVVLRVRAALTCGSDIKAYLRGHPKWPMPTPFGHEFAGEVSEVGAGVRNVREGDGVMVVPTAPCGECYYCAHGDENLCDAVSRDYVVGGYGEYVKLPARVVSMNTFPKPDGLSFAEAALLEPLSCVVHGLSMVPLRPDSSVVLVGAGAISLLHVVTLQAMGVEDVIVVGRGENRARLARAFGVRAAFSGGLHAAVHPVHELTEGRGADVVIECTGAVDVWTGAPSLARRGGWVVLFGGCPVGSTVTFDTRRLHYDELRIVSPHHFTPRAVRWAYEMLTSGAVPGHRLISGEFPLEGLAEALHRHQSGLGVKFAVIA